MARRVCEWTVVASSGLRVCMRGALLCPCAPPEANAGPLVTCSPRPYPLADRLNLFTLEGDLLRCDLDLEAHIPSTLQPNSWVILEKGNRVSPGRLAAIRQAAVEAQSGGGCLVM